MDRMPAVKVKVVSAPWDGIAPALLLTIHSGKLHTTPIQYLVNSPEGFARLVLEHRCRPGPGLRALLLTDLSQAAQGGLAGLLLRLRQDGHSTLRLVGPAGLHDTVDGLSYFVRWTHPSLELTALTSAQQGAVYDDDCLEVRPLWSSCLLWKVPVWLADGAVAAARDREAEGDAPAATAVAAAARRAERRNGHRAKRTRLAVSDGAGVDAAGLAAAPSGSEAPGKGSSAAGRTRDEGEEGGGGRGEGAAEVGTSGEGGGSDPRVTAEPFLALRKSILRTSAAAAAAVAAGPRAVAPLAAAAAAGTSGLRTTVERGAAGGGRGVAAAAGAAAGPPGALDASESSTAESGGGWDSGSCTTSSAADTDAEGGSEGGDAGRGGAVAIGRVKRRRAVGQVNGRTDTTAAGRGNLGKAGPDRQDGGSSGCDSSSSSSSSSSGSEGDSDSTSTSTSAGSSSKGEDGSGDSDSDGDANADGDTSDDEAASGDRPDAPPTKRPRLQHHQQQRRRRPAADGGTAPTGCRTAAAPTDDGPVGPKSQSDLFSELDRLFLAGPPLVGVLGYGGKAAGFLLGSGSRGQGLRGGRGRGRGRGDGDGGFRAAGEGGGGRGFGAGAATAEGPRMDAALRAQVLERLKLVSERPPAQTTQPQPQSRSQPRKAAVQSAPSQPLRPPQPQSDGANARSGRAPGWQRGQTAVRPQQHAAVASPVGNAARGGLGGGSGGGTATPPHRPNVEPPLGYLLWLKPTRQALLVVNVRSSAAADALAEHPVTQLLRAAPPGLLMAVAHMTPPAVARRVSYRAWVRHLPGPHVWCWNQGEEDRVTTTGEADKAAACAEVGKHERGAPEGPSAAAEEEEEKEEKGGQGQGGRDTNSDPADDPAEAAEAAGGAAEAVLGSARLPGGEVEGEEKAASVSARAIHEPGGSAGCLGPGQGPGPGPGLGLGHLGACRVTMRLNAVAPAIFPLPFALRRGPGVGPGGAGASCRTGGKELTAVICPGGCRTPVGTAAAAAGTSAVHLPRHLNASLLATLTSTLTAVGVAASNALTTANGSGSAANGRGGGGGGGAAGSQAAGGKTGGKTTTVKGGRPGKLVSATAAAPVVSAWVGGLGCRAGAAIGRTAGGGAGADKDAGASLSAATAAAVAVALELPPAEALQREMLQERRESGLVEMLQALRRSCPALTRSTEAVRLLQMQPRPRPQPRAAPPQPDQRADLQLGLQPQKPQQQQQQQKQLLLQGPDQHHQQPPGHLNNQLQHQQAPQQAPHQQRQGSEVSYRTAADPYPPAPAPAAAPLRGHPLQHPHPHQQLGVHEATSRGEPRPGQPSQLLPDSHRQQQHQQHWWSPGEGSWARGGGGGGGDSRLQPAPSPVLPRPAAPPPLPLPPAAPGSSLGRWVWVPAPGQPGTCPSEAEARAELAAAAAAHGIVQPGGAVMRPAYSQPSTATTTTMTDPRAGIDDGYHANGNGLDAPQAVVPYHHPPAPAPPAFHNYQHQWRRPQQPLYPHYPPHPPVHPQQHQQQHPYQHHPYSSEDTARGQLLSGPWWESGQPPGGGPPPPPGGSASAPPPKGGGTMYDTGPPAGWGSGSPASPAVLIRVGGGGGVDGRTTTAPTVAAGPNAAAVSSNRHVASQLRALLRPAAAAATAGTVAASGSGTVAAAATAGAAVAAAATTGAAVVGRGPGAGAVAEAGPHLVKRGAAGADGGVGAVTGLPGRPGGAGGDGALGDDGWEASSVIDNRDVARRVRRRLLEGSRAGGGAGGGAAGDAVAGADAVAGRTACGPLADGDRVTAGSKPAAQAAAAGAAATVAATDVAAAKVEGIAAGAAADAATAAEACGDGGGAHFDPEANNMDNRMVAGRLRAALRSQGDGGGGPPGAAATAAAATAAAATAAAATAAAGTATAAVSAIAAGPSPVTAVAAAEGEREARGRRPGGAGSVAPTEAVGVGVGEREDAPAAVATAAEMTAVDETGGPAPQRGPPQGASAEGDDGPAPDRQPGSDELTEAAAAAVQAYDTELALYDTLVRPPPPGLHSAQPKAQMTRPGPGRSAVGGMSGLLQQGDDVAWVEEGPPPACLLPRRDTAATSRPATSSKGSPTSCPAGDVTVLFLGTGSAEPSKYRGASAVLVRNVGPSRGSLMIDAGEGAFGALARWLGRRGAVAQVAALSLVWLSHKHPDHVLGLPTLLEARPPGAAPLLVVGPQEVGQWLSKVAALHPSWSFTFLHCGDFSGNAAASSDPRATDSTTTARFVGALGDGHAGGTGAGAFGTSSAAPPAPPPPPAHPAGAGAPGGPRTVTPFPGQACYCCPPYSGHVLPYGVAPLERGLFWPQDVVGGGGQEPRAPPSEALAAGVAAGLPGGRTAARPPPGAAARLRWHQQRRALAAPQPTPPPVTGHRQQGHQPQPQQQQRRQEQEKRQQQRRVAAAVCTALGFVRWQSIAVHHCRDAWGLVLEHADGWKLVYSGDTRPCPALVSAGRGATLLIHEATFEPCLDHQARSKRHSTSEEAAAVAREMGAYRTVLTHFSQRYPRIPAGIEPWALPLRRRPVPAFDGMLLPLSALPALPLIMPPLALALAEPPLPARTTTTMAAGSAPAVTVPDEKRGEEEEA